MSDTGGAGRPHAEASVGVVVQRTVAVALVLTVLLVLLRPHDPNIDYSTPWVLAGLVVGLAAAGGATLLARRTRRTSGSRVPARHTAVWSGALATSVLGGGLGVLLALPLRYTYGWDAAVVTGFSRELSDGSLSAYAEDYLSRYPNNVPLVALMNIARALGRDSDAGMYNAYIVANGVSLAVVLLLTFALVRMLRGTRSAFVAQGAVFGLVGCSPWMAVPYTDFPAMPFVVGAVVMAVAAGRVRSPQLRVALVVAAFVSVAIGYVIKSTPATTAVALALVGLVVLVGTGGRRRAATAAVLAAGVAAFALTAVGALAVADRVSDVSRGQLDTTRTAPPTWWLANGLTTTPSIYGRPYYGAYNPQMVRDSMKLSGSRLHDWSDERLEQQLRSMGVDGVAAFEVRKHGFNWGDGMFFAWGEGYDFQTSRLHDHGDPARAVQAWQHPSGAHYLVRASLTNGLWLALLLWAGVGLLRAAYRRDLLIVVMTVLGIAVFTLVFQGRSRYLFAYVPVVVALAAAVNPLRRDWSVRRTEPG